MEFQTKEELDKLEGAGVIHKPKVIINKRTRGRDLTAVVADHRDQVTTDKVAHAKPWSSR